MVVTREDRRLQLVGVHWTRIGLHELQLLLLHVQLGFLG